MINNHLNYYQHKRESSQAGSLFYFAMQPDYADYAFAHTEIFSEKFV